MSKQLMFMCMLVISVYTGSYAQLTIKPEKPIPGETISFTYNPPAGVFAADDTIRCTAYRWGLYDDQEALRMGRSYKPLDVRLVKNGNRFEGEISTDNLTRAITLQFTSGNVKFKQVENKMVLISGKVDTHDSVCYCKPLYNDEGTESEYSNYFIGQYYAWGAYQELGFSNPKKAKEHLLHELELYPITAMARVYGLLPYVVSDSDKSEMELNYKKAMNTVFEKNDLTEKDYTLISGLAYALKLRGLSDYINKTADEKFSDGSGIKGYSKLCSRLDNEKDISKKLILLSQVKESFNRLDYESKSMFAFDSRLPVIVVADFLRYVLATGDLNLYNQYCRDFGYSVSSQLYSDFNLNADIAVMADTLKKPELAEEKGNEYINYLKLQLKALQEGTYTPRLIDDQYLTLKDKKQNIISSLTTLNLKMAQLKFDIGSYSKAMTFCRDAKSYAGRLSNEFWDMPGLNELYCKLAEKTMPLKECKAEVENMVASGYWTEEMTAILKRIYVKEHKTDDGFDAYLANLKKKQIDDLKKSLQANLINEPAPLFSLSDADGKTVKLEDYKGKIVILDFWATWCGPCKASFPGMKKLQETYAGNPDVKLLFVDTFERFKTLDENVEKVKEFLTQNNYPFHVVFDQKGKVASDFKVSAIPTKCIIDKNGNIRYRITGAETNVGKLLDEMSAMIESIK